MTQKIIVTNHSSNWVKLFIPHGMEFIIKSVKDFERMGIDEIKKYDVYYLSDAGYDSVSKIINNPSDGSCHKLSLLCNDKFKCRSEMNTLQDIPFKIVEGRNIQVDWSDKDELLIAKPVDGTGSNNLHVVKHGDHINNEIGYKYILEKYIDDKYPRICVDGYICGDEIGILSIWDNIYHKDNPTKLHMLNYPSKYSNLEGIYKKFKKVVKELKEKTQCNNQVFDIEFFIINENDIRVMEINPRIGGNYLPMYHITGYNPFIVSETLKEGKIPEITEKIGKGCTKYLYSNKNKCLSKCKKNNIYYFSFAFIKSYQHAFSYTYDENVDISELHGVLDIFN